MRKWRWKNLHWTTRRDLKLAFWVMLIAAPIIAYFLLDSVSSPEDGSTSYAAVDGTQPRQWRGR